MSTRAILLAGFLAWAGLGCSEAPASVGMSAEAMRGREVFLHQSAPACGTCHVLRDAGTRGAIGPDLDELQADAERVRRAVTEGLDPMPSQRLILTPEQIDAVARYVVEAVAATESLGSALGQ